MRAEEIGSQEAKFSFTRGEVGELAALAIKHSDNEELRVKFEAAFAVMGLVSDNDDIEAPAETSTTVTLQQHGSRTDQVLGEASIAKLETSRPSDIVPVRRRSRRRLGQTSVEAVSFRDIVGDRAADRALGGTDAKQAQAASYRRPRRKQRRFPPLSRAKGPSREG